MTLTLSVLRCPDAVPPETKRVTGGEFRVGRGQDNEWIMPDPDRVLSKKHFVIAFRNGGWALADTSTNGTFLNRDADPVGQGQIRGLSDGDRIRFGAYEVEVRIADDRIADDRGYGAAPQGFGGRAASPFDDPFGDDVFATRPPVAETFTSSAFGNDPLFGGAPPSQSVAMPPRYDPLAPNVSDDDFFGSPSVADHSPAFSDAFKPPPVAPKLIPDDDWDLGFPSATPAPVRPPAPPVVAYQPPALPAAPAVPVAPAAPYPPPPAAIYQPPQPVPSASPFAETADVPARPAAIAPAPPPPAPASPSPAQADLLQSFLEGAAMAGRRPEDPQSAMRAIGAAFRATVAGIRQALIARSSIKGEFRIEQTMIRSRGNNPLKFSADDDDALSALLGIGRRTDMTADAAVADALRDMRLHELATVAAMQGAVRAMLAQLDPAKIRAQSDAAGGMALLPAQKKAKAFEAYEKLHDQVTRALADDFDSVFGKAFARAYEAALRDISAREPP